MSGPGQPGDIALRLPRPGRALKAVLGLLIGFAILSAVMGDIIPRWLAFSPSDFTSLKSTPHLPHFWAFLTSGLLTPPDVVAAIFSIIGLYFAGAPDLERRWGGARLLRFLGFAVVFGNLAVLAGSFIPIARESLHPAGVVGPWAAIAAITVAWAKDNWSVTTRWMGVLPLSGKILFYLAIGLSVAAVVFGWNMAEGACAPLGGVLAGYLFSGNPSPARTAWLKFRLGRMRRQAGSGGVTVSELLGDMDTPRSSRPATKRNPKGPALRIVQGGLDDDLKNRKLPKDKRYLN